MRIAQVAPLYECVPPHGYGATERVVHYLTEALVEQGHHVTLFATADSTTSAEFVPICERGLWRDSRVWDTLAHHVREVEAVIQRAGRFDVVHFHIDPLYFPAARRLPCAHVTRGALHERSHGAGLHARLRGVVGRPRGAGRIRGTRACFAAPRVSAPTRQERLSLA